MATEWANGFFSEKNVQQLLFLEVLRATFEAFAGNYSPLKKANSDKNDDEDNDNEQSRTGKGKWMTTPCLHTQNMMDNNENG